ncbi:MAG TPA: hypothetical protein VMU75_01640 [Acidimicrobiales bacterium]|nr:hypothetical protein [Acidimicrobiales bacterium]
MDLMSAAEIAALLRVSRQRVDKITKTDPKFPEPVGVLRGMRIWDRTDVERWARETGRLK